MPKKTSILNFPEEVDEKNNIKAGKSSTLLNPGETTNFIYKIVGASLSDADIDAINAIKSSRKIRDRVKVIADKGARLEYLTMRNQTFKNNLMLIDTSMPQIVAEMLRIAYSTNEMNVRKVVDAVTKENPLGFDMTAGQPYYEYKIKQLLVDVALGMMPATAWNGIYEANGGYLVVKENGDVICYHSYERNLFEDYLFYNTKFDSPSTTRYNYAKVYRDGVDTLFALNLQIRFY